ncbi:TIGR03936 family radical SAM-associated protein [Clostridiaceae bacterium M8S5]|nr:TIGR03936 family radical SAM-associated protein [Clostridiaceae bacterium M8S5]
MNLIRAKFKKGGYLKYISHLDLMRLMYRALRRADIPVVYTQGFNPQPRISFATALSLGVESEGEYIDIELGEKINEEEFVQRLNHSLPEGIEIIKAKYINNKKSIMSLIRWSQYVIEMKFDREIERQELQKIIDAILIEKSIMHTKIGKKKGKKVKKVVEIRNLIKDIDILMLDNDTAIIKSTLRTGSDGNLKPEVLIEVIKKYFNELLTVKSFDIQRIELFVEKDDKIISPLA